MNKFKHPTARIGTLVSGAATSPKMNAVKPSFGDLIGNGLWRFGAALASTGRIVQAFGQDEENAPRQTQYTDTNHPDHPSWNSHFGRK